MCLLFPAGRLTDTSIKRISCSEIFKHKFGNNSGLDISELLREIFEKMDSWTSHLENSRAVSGEVLQPVLPSFFSKFINYILIKCIHI